MEFKVKVIWTGEKKGEFRAQNKERLEVATPPEFQGPKGIWSPEELFVAAVNSCLMTTFLFFAQGSRRINLLSYESEGAGILEEVEGKLKFTRVILRPKVTVSSDTEILRVQKVLEIAKEHCPIFRSLLVEVKVEPQIGQRG